MNAHLISEDYLYAIQQRNLVYNCDFRYFSNQVSNGNIIDYGIPDGWQYKDTGSNGSINFDTENNQLVIKKSQNTDLMQFSQALHEFPRWKKMLLSKTITAKVCLNLGLEGEISIILSDGISSTTVTKNGKGNWVVELHLKVDATASKVTISIQSAVPFMTINLSKVVANVGLVALENLSCIVEGVIGERKQYIATETSPAEELSLCNEPTELSSNHTRLDSVINGRFGRGQNGRSLLIDMRGYFSRAWNNGSAIDPDASKRKAPNSGTVTGDHVSTFEEDIFLKHDHGLNFGIDKPILTGDKGSATIVNTTVASKTNSTSEGKETRPKNIAELYTIKWA